MKRENGWCKWLCIFGLFLLHCSSWVRCYEAILVSGSTSITEVAAPEDVTTTQTIRSTKVTEEITDNSILISPTPGQYLEEIASLGTSTIVMTDEDNKVPGNETTAQIPDESVVQNVSMDYENQTEPAVSDRGTAEATLHCSDYAINIDIVDLSVDGDYRHVRHKAYSNHRHKSAGPNDDHVSEGTKNSNDTLAENHFYNFVYSLDGDYTVTLITDQDDFSASLFAVDRINELQLINDTGTLGLRIVHVRNISRLQQLLEYEITYLKDCLPQSIGIFIAESLWPAIHTVVDSLDYNIYPFPASNDLLYAKAAHLLYELPWHNPNSSIAVRSESAECSNKFTAICRHEHLCLENFPSDDTIFIILGLTRSVSFATNGTVIVVLSGHDMLFISDLPDRSYLIAENEINLSALESEIDFISYRYGTKLLASEILSSGSVFLEVVELLNLLSDGNCQKSTDNACDSLNETLSNWKYYAKLPSQKIISDLKLENVTHLMTFELRQKFSLRSNSSEIVLDLKPVASSNMVTNVTTVFHFNEFKDQHDEPLKLGNIFYCTKEFEIRHPDFGNHRRPIYYGNDYIEMYWQIKQEAWVAAGLTVSSLGILFCLAILIFLIVRVCMDDVLEGNPFSSILLLVSLIFQFASFLPFSLEYTGYVPDLMHKAETIYTWNTLCTIKIFLVSVCYCITFSLLLCRAIMLASIGSEGGFLSHVNGYLQSVICVFSTLVQLGLSTQLVIVLHANAHNISCNEIYFGNWFWAIIAYDGMLLSALIFLSPFIFRSQRNYREGLLLVTGSVLCLIIWTTWIPLCMFGYEWREAAVSLGLVASALAVLVGIMIPRCFLMVRSIARSDLVQALPSLTSLAFAQANQYISEQSVYECVNPAMRQQRSSTTETFMEHEIDDPYLATSEIPTLPLRGNRRSHHQEVNGNGSANFYGISNPYSCSDSITSELSPNKITRF